MEGSEIIWTDNTFSPWEGCQKVSPGCRHCYAEARDKLYHRGENWGPEGSRLIHSAAYFDQPRKWNDAARKAGRIARVFCGSLCDILEPGSYLDGPRQIAFDMVSQTPHLMWLFLTKRPENWALFPADWRVEWPANAMFGWTAENDEWMMKRAIAWHQARIMYPGLRTFISAEPLLGQLKNLRSVLASGRIDWVIGGGESGNQARPMHPDWIRGVRDECVYAGVPFLCKQWGEWAPGSMDPHVINANYHQFNDGTEVIRVGKHAAGRLLDGIKHNGLPLYWPANVGMPPKPKKSTGLTKAQHADLLSPLKVIS